MQPLRRYNIRGAAHREAGARGARNRGSGAPMGFLRRDPNDTPNHSLARGNAMQIRKGFQLTLAVVMVSAIAAGCKSNVTDPEGPVVPGLPDRAGTVLIREDFDGENGGVGRNNWTAFAQWTVAAGCVDLHGNGFYDVQAGNGLYVDLDGSCGQAGTLDSKTEFTLEPGTYVLEFWLAGSQRSESPDTVEVSLGTTFSEQIVMQRNDQFRLFTRRIDVGSRTTARLRFRNFGGDNQGALLDVIRLRQL